jgi:hypothetical protein
LGGAGVEDGSSLSLSLSRASSSSSLFLSFFALQTERAALHPQAQKRSAANKQQKQTQQTNHAKLRIKQKVCITRARAYTCTPWREEGL